MLEGTYLYGEKVVDPDELMNFTSLQNSSIKSIMPSVGAKGPLSIDERLQVFAKNGQKIKSVDDIINKIDYKKAVNEAEIGLSYVVSTKKTQKDIREDSSNKDLDSESYKNNTEYVKTKEAIQKELEEKYSSKVNLLTSYIYSPKSKTSMEAYDYSDPNYRGI